MKRKAKIYYTALDDFWRKEEKLNWLRDNPISKIEFERIEPDEKHNWINQTDNDFETLLPLIDKDVKFGKKDDSAIFELYSLGVATNRDIWNYDLDKKNLERKAAFFCDYYAKSKAEYLKLQDKKSFKDSEIKFTDEILDHFDKNSSLTFDKNKIRTSLYRPFVKKWTYLDRIITHRIYQQDKIFPINDKDKTNLCIGFIGKDTVVPFSVLAFNQVNDLNGLSNAAGGTKTLPLYRYDSENQKHENITDWALHQFQTHYGTKSEPSAVADGLSRQEQKIKGKLKTAANISPANDSLAQLQPPAAADGSDARESSQITRQDIFYYVYAVLHSPAYRKKYEQNLKREFPRLPFYDDFFRWRDWGERLMDLHINYETIEPFPLERMELDLTPKRKIVQNTMSDQIGNKIINDFVSKPRTKLRADKAQGIIEIDTITQLAGVPPLAWEYKLGNRSAIEWILDQYKERKPKDATIAEKFNTYKFEDYKEQVIDLLMRVCNVSVKTMEIINQMPNE